MRARPLITSLRAALVPLVWLIVATPLSVRAAQEWETIAPNPDIDFVYLPANQQYDGIRQRLINYRILERLQRFFAPFRLPHHLQLKTHLCGEQNAFYKPSERSLTLCYEEVAAIVAAAPKTDKPGKIVTREAAIFGGLAGVLLHESGHMMFDMFDVPRFGREEDAADEMSAFLALQVSRRMTKAVIIGFEYSFFTAVARGQEAPNAPRNFWSDEHGSASQRVYNILCLAYGKDPTAFRTFVDRGWLPMSRAAGCAAEYDQVKRAFEQTISPFVDPVLLARVEAVEWLSDIKAPDAAPDGPQEAPHPGGLRLSPSGSDELR